MVQRIDDQCYCIPFKLIRLPSKGMDSVTKSLNGMNFNQTFSILFWINKSKVNKKGLVSIWVRVTIDGRRAECSTSRQIQAEFWNSELGQPTENFPEAASLSQYLLMVKAGITKHYNILLSTKDQVTAEDVKNSYKGIREKVVMFLEVFEHFN